jgi:hypothetical protein
MLTTPEAPVDSVTVTVAAVRDGVLIQPIYHTHRGPTGRRASQRFGRRCGRGPGRCIETRDVRRVVGQGPLKRDG